MTKDNPVSSGSPPEIERIAVLAGSGNLPEIVANAISAGGRQPLVLMVEGEAGPTLKKYDHKIIQLAGLADAFRFMKSHNVTEIVLAGGISRRPRLMEFRLSWKLLRALPLITRGLARGDDGILRAVINLMETNGLRVVGVHEIVPDIVASEGAITRRKPRKSDWKDIQLAIAASRLLGKFDVGQASVSVGGRIVALEGAEGTAAMLGRVAELRDAGRISATKPGVLVKCLKPGQEIRADMPAIGPDTILQAKKAGLSGIVLQAGGALILDHEQTVSSADAENLFVFGFCPDLME